jgi:hypothetical protein
MIKLKNILSEGMYGRFWWMNPLGKLTRIMKTDLQTGHKESAEQILLAMGIEPSSKDVFEQMYDLGWVRVECVGDQGRNIISFNCGFNKQPSNKQMQSMKELAIELKAFEIRNNSNPKQRIELY